MIWISNEDLEDFLNTDLTLSLILWFNLRLGGYSIWSASTSRTIYDQDFVAWAPHSLGTIGSTWTTTRHMRRKAQKQPEGHSDYLKYSKTLNQVLDACRTRVQRARGLVRPGAAGLLIGIECSRVKDSTWMYLNLSCNYPNRCRTSSSTKETIRLCCSRTPTVLG